MRLSRKLDRWIQSGLLTEEQRRRILEFEDETRNSARWLVWSVAATGGLAIAAGVVSLIAANWDEIPAGVKLFAGVALLAATAVAALRLDDRAEGWIAEREAAALDAAAVDYCLEEPLFGGFTPSSGAAVILAPATCTNIPFLGPAAMSGILIELTSVALVR